MSSAEFSKAGLTSHAEPVEVRRYRELVGTWYPASHVLGQTSVDEALVSKEAADLRIENTELRDQLAEAQKIVDEQVEEIKSLKKELAARLPVPDAWKPKPAAIASIGPVEFPSQQDADFFERKLGKKK